MAQGITLYSDVDDILPKFIGPATYFYDHAGEVKPLVTKDTLPEGSGSTYYIPRFPRLTAAHLQDGEPINQMQKISTDEVIAVTPGEVGVQVLVGRRAARMAKEDVMRAVGKLTGNAMALIEDLDLITLFSAVTNSKGSTGSSLLIGQVTAAKSAIAGGSGNPGQGPFYGVLHEWQHHDIAEGVIGIESGVLGSGFGIQDGMAADVLQKWNVSRLGAIELHIDSNLPIVAASTSTTGCVFTPEAFHWVEFSGMETTTEYDNDLRATKINVISDYGTALFDTRFACRVISDATEPTN